MKYYLENNQLKVNVDSDGMQIESILFKNKEYVYQRNNEWKKSWPVCFPVAGAFINDIYLYNNKKYNLKKHGFYNDIKNWKLIKNEKSILIFEFTHVAQFYENYPFLFKLKLVFEIDNNEVKQYITITNIDNKNIYFGFGWHPSFILNRKTGYVQFEKTDRLYSYTSPYVDLNNLNFNEVDRFIIKNYNFNNKETYSLLFNKNKELMLIDNDRKIIINCDGFQQVLFWKINNNANYLCVEPWSSWPDVKTSNSSELSQKFTFEILEPHKTKKYKLICKFEK